MKKLVWIFLVVLSSSITHAQLPKHHHANIPTSFAKTYDPRSDTIDILNYQINLNITDFSTRIISGNTKVTFTPKLHNVQYIRLDLQSLTVDSVTQNGIKIQHSHTSPLLSVKLTTPMHPGDTGSVRVFYKGVPSGDPTGWGGFYFQSGYAYNLGVGFGSNPHVYGRVWFPCFDNFIERSSYDFNITTNNGKIAYCNGALTADVNNLDGSRTRTWKLEEQIPTYLASVAVGNYVDLKMNHPGIEKNIPILVATVAADSTKNKASLIHLPDAIEAFENSFGPYQWNKVGYTLVPFTQGAMEHATSIGYPKSSFNGTLVSEKTMAHELAHHWFGNLITPSSQEVMWISEGWASYCEHLFSEKVYGRASYISALRSDNEELLHFLKYQEGDLSLDSIPWDYTYGSHVYTKGSIISHNLRGYMGDSLFFSSLKKVLTQLAFKSINNDEFEQALSQASGLDLSDFFNDWVKQSGWSHFAIDSAIVTPFNNAYKAKLFIKQRKYNNPRFHNNVPVEITFLESITQQRTVKASVSGEYSTIEIEIPFEPKMIVLNSNDLVLHAVSSEQKVIKTTGTNPFVLGKMSVTTNSINDSVLLRIEHNYVGAGGNYKNNIERISPQRYWKIDGLFSNNFKASGILNYDGRTGITSGNVYLDHLLKIVNEDSLLLLYRKNTSEEWEEYPYYKKEQGNKNDKYGTIRFDSLQKGEYCFGIGKSLYLGVNEQKKNKSVLMEVYPNPSSDFLFIELKNQAHQQNDYTIQIIDLQGKLLYVENGVSFIKKHRMDLSQLADGNYILRLLNKGKTLDTHKITVLQNK